MENELTIYEASRAIATAHRGNYSITCGAMGNVDLVRNTDFGVPEANGKRAFKQPILYKSGAEKLAFGFGLCQRYSIESKIEERIEGGLFFHYTIRCDLVKPTPNGEIVISNAYGSANTSESRNGYKSAADSANSTLKMAQKRALVGAALAISGLSDLFTQDIENEAFMDGSKAILTESPENKITSKQIQRIFAIASGAGLNTEQAKQKLKAMGFASTKDVTQGDYDKVCAAMEGKTE